MGPAGVEYVYKDELRKIRGFGGRRPGRQPRPRPRWPPAWTATRPVTAAG